MAKEGASFMEIKRKLKRFDIININFHMEREMAI
jgi:hypothetical protein